MSTLVFGFCGQVASELRRHDDVISVGRDSCDIADPAAIEGAIRAHSPRAVINAAAYTAVDKAETEVALAMRMNGDAPTTMARLCAELDIPFIHLSTDYVFDGSGNQPWLPNAIPGPINAYGRSKLAGEDGVRAAGGRYAILRTSWMFSEHGNNFVSTMLRIAGERDEISVVADQIGGPTPANAVAQACISIAHQLADDPVKAGTYHFSGTPDVSWFEFAQAIFARSGQKVAVYPITSGEYPTAAIRPLNSRFDCGATRKVFGIDKPDWCTALNTVISALQPSCVSSPPPEAQ